MKNLVTNLYCRKSLLLVLTLLFGAGQVYAAGKAGGQSPRLAVSTLSEVMSLQPLDKSKWPMLRLGILSLIGGTGVILTGDMAQSMWFTGLGVAVTACGVFFCVGKALGLEVERGVKKSNVTLSDTRISGIGIKASHRVKKVRIRDHDIVIYESDGDYELGLIDMAESDDLSRTTVASADGVKDTIKLKQIRHVLDLIDNFFNGLDEQATLGVSLFKLIRDAPHEFLDNAVVAFERNGKSYLNTFSGIQHTEDGGVSLAIKYSSSGEIVIDVDSEGKPVLDGEPLQAVIFLP